MDLAVRAIVLYAVIMFIMRVIGRRELTQLAPMDLILLIVIGDAVQQGLTQDDYSMTGAIIVIGTLAVLQVGTSYVAFRSKRVRKILEGDPIIVIEDGKLIDRNLRRERLSAEEVAEEMRQQQIAAFEDVQWGIVESNGQLSFIKKSG